MYAHNDVLVGGYAGDVWDQRLEALKVVMDAMIGDYTLAAPHRWATLKAVLLCLRKFSDNRFSYFHDNFNKRKLKISKDLLPDTTLGIVMDQIDSDLTVIARAVQQRASGPAALTERLKKTDEITLRALQPAITRGLFPSEKRPTVVTYFDKSPNTRVQPYAPVALIGVPYSSLSLNRDLLAIPHEVGHYVFRHGEYQGKSLADYFLNELGKIVPATDSLEYRRLRRWLDELFADVYGCLVGGPALALDFQDLQLHNTRTDFDRDNSSDRHPVPVLRPRIYLQILRRIGGGWGQWANLLARLWDVRLAARTTLGQAQSLDAHERAAGFAVFVDESGRPIQVASAISDEGLAATSLDRLIGKMVEVIGSVAMNLAGDLDDVSGVNPQALTLTQLDETAETLYGSFGRFVVSVSPASQSNLDPDDATAAQWLQNVPVLSPLAAGSELSFEEWFPQMKTEGWATEGPTSHWP